MLLQGAVVGGGQVCGLEGGILLGLRHDGVIQGLSHGGVLQGLGHDSVLQSLGHDVVHLCLDGVLNRPLLLLFGLSKQGGEASKWVALYWVSWGR